MPAETNMGHLNLDFARIYPVLPYFLLIGSAKAYFRPKINYYQIHRGCKGLKVIDFVQIWKVFFPLLFMTPDPQNYLSALGTPSMPQNR